ncbi:hypothetical protein [Deinococcus seoulensis]|uniref:hypothetical protein n=1 Tax=Deinococcus seoulensis TaxID=1837379 RepID=UPI00166C8285|nr:hypothetical protein [Deinococcus seoulensis]
MSALTLHTQSPTTAARVDPPRAITTLAALNLAAPPTPTAAWVTVQTTWYTRPDPRSPKLQLLPARRAVTLHRCFERWCEVSVPGNDLRGWVMRPTVDLKGDCAVLVPLGLKDLRRSEGTYSAARDLNHNGRACDREDLLATRP